MVLGVGLSFPLLPKNPVHQQVLPFWWGSTLPSLTQHASPVPAPPLLDTQQLPHWAWSSPLGPSTPSQRALWVYFWPCFFTILLFNKKLRRPALPLLDTYLKELEPGTHTGRLVHTRAIAALLPAAKRWRQRRCPRMDGKTAWSGHTMDCHWAMKSSDVLTHATMWWTLKTC